MAACTSCGAKAGMGKKLCQPCTEVERQRLAAEQQARAERDRLEEIERQRAVAERKRIEDEARQRRFEEFLDLRLASLQNLLDQGITPYLYDSMIIDSQSYFNESPNPRSWNFKTATGPVGALTDVASLQAMGWEGWNVIGVVPVTFGSTLYNTVGGNTVHGAAYGGMVVGASLLLSKPVTRDFLVQSRDQVIELLSKEFPG